MTSASGRQSDGTDKMLAAGQAMTEIPAGDTSKIATSDFEMASRMEI
jgi:hypothetical protein